MSNICVFCASSVTKNVYIAEDCVKLAELIVQRGDTLVYGGAFVGLMGLLADTVLKNGGKAIGIMPKSLTSREIAKEGLTESYITSSMAERKELLIAKSDAFVILPGGFGTLDEFFEVVCLGSLGLCRKPIVILNSQNYYAKLLEFLQYAGEQGMLPYPYQNIISVVNGPEEIFAAIDNYQLPPIPEWMNA